MSVTLSNSREREAWWGRLLPDAIRNGSPDVVRRAGVFLLITGLGASIGLLSSIVHFSTGDVARACFNVLVGLPILSALFVLRWTGRMDVAMHYLCAIFTCGLIASPFFAVGSPPISIGMIAVPFAAAAMGGARGGMIWTVTGVVVLTAVAWTLPIDGASKSLAWNTVIVAGCCGIAVTLSERSRERAMDESLAARARAERDSKTRARAEEALRDSQLLFSTAFRRTPSILIVAALESGEILDVNEAFVRISGWTSEESLGRTLSDLGIWPSQEERDRLRQMVVSTGSAQNVELTLRTKAGASISLLASAEILELGGRPCLLAQGIDITDRKRNDEALALYRTELEERVAERGEQLRASLVRLRDQERLVAVGTLAAGIAHQINNPIAGIAAAAQFALLPADGADRDAIQEEALETVLEEARRCGRIVKSVLQFARDEPTTKWVEDLNPTVHRASELVRSYVHHCGGRLEIELCEEPLPVRMSPIDIEQVVVNLLRNAAESRRDGARVEVRTERADGEARIYVTDDGDGLDRETRTRLFEPFYTTRLEEGGSGLGLSVVHGIVGDHAGKLEIETLSGGGTRFGIHLPLMDGDASA